MKKNMLARYITKRSTILQFLIFSFWIFSMGYAVAEENIITVNQALDLALTHNQTLKQSSNQVLISGITVNQKKSDFYPSLSFSADSSQQYYKSVNTTTGIYENANSQYVDASISANLNLFNGFYDSASLRQARLELKADEGNYLRSSESITFETLQRYIQTLLSRELIEVQNQNLKAQQLQLELIQDFFNAGKRSIADLHLQKAEISSAEYSLLDAKRNYTISILQLLQTLGLSPNTTYKTVDIDIDSLLKEIDVPLNSSTELIPQSLEKRSDLEAQQFLVKAAEQKIKTAKAGALPKLYLVMNLGTDYSSVNKLADFSHQLFDKNLNATVGLSLSVPIFDKNSTKNNIAVARINLQNQQLELEKQKNQAAVEIQQALEDFQTASQQLVASENQLIYTRDALESIEARYKEQTSTILELTQARSRYTEASYDRIKSKYNLLIQAIATAYYKGNLDEIVTIIKKFH